MGVGARLECRGRGVVGSRQGDAVEPPVPVRCAEQLAPVRAQRQKARRRRQLARGPLGQRAGRVERQAKRAGPGPIATVARRVQGVARARRERRDARETLGPGERRQGTRGGVQIEHVDCAIPGAGDDDERPFLQRGRRLGRGFLRRGFLRQGFLGRGFLGRCCLGQRVAFLGRVRPRSLGVCYAVHTPPSSCDTPDLTTRASNTPREPPHRQAEEDRGEYDGDRKVRPD